MTFKTVTFAKCAAIEDENGVQYVRFGADRWYRWWRNTLEPVYAKAKELEEAYVAWIKARKETMVG